MASGPNQKENELTTGTSEAGPIEDRTVQGTATLRTGRKARAVAPGNTETPRFFLAKAGSSNGIPEMGKEVPGEAEAIVESLKTGLHYFAVFEWRGVADLTGKRPQLAREAARNPAKPG